MYVDGEVVKDYRIMNNLDLSEMANLLAITPEELQLYEEGADWYVEDVFLIYFLNTIVDDMSFISEKNVESILEEYN